MKNRNEVINTLLLKYIFNVNNKFKNLNESSIIKMISII